MTGTNHLTGLQYRGVEIDAQSLRWIERLVGENPRLSRTDIALLFCRRLDLRRRNGAFAVDRCRLFLGRLAKRGVLTLPPARRSNHYRMAAPEAGAVAEAKSGAAVLDTMQGRVFALRLVLTSERQRMAALLSVHHYLGNPGLVGERLCYVATLDGQWVALCVWAAAALKNGPRDQMIGWDAGQKAARLHLVVNNVRFLILPHARVPHLASRVLGANLKILRRDWQAQYGHDVLLAETFVDSARFLGTCYRASNWRYLGQTQGYGRSAQGYKEHGQKKAVYVYALSQKAQAILCAPPDTKHHEARPSMQALSLENLPSGLDGVAHRFAAILDPRKARGKRHPLSAIFTVCICATLCGAKSFDAMEQWARAQSREVLKKLGCRYGRPPSERTIRRMLQKTGVSLDDATTQWQAEFLSLKGEAVALDGKTLRGSHKGGENRKHLLSAVDHRGARILAQVEVGEKTNEIPCAIPLLNKIAIEGAVITGDAMHTQRELARYLVDDRKADYVFTVKDNQPKLKEDIARLDWAAIPPSASN